MVGQLDYDSPVVPQDGPQDGEVAAGRQRNIRDVIASLQMLLVVDNLFPDQAAGMFGKDNLTNKLGARFVCRRYGTGTVIRCTVIFH
jgi:hypothetical protein